MHLLFYYKIQANKEFRRDKIDAEILDTHQMKKEVADYTKPKAQ